MKNFSKVFEMKKRVKSGYVLYTQRVADRPCSRNGCPEIWVGQIPETFLTISGTVISGKGYNFL
ncbi:ORF56 [White spot syndrome virus]|uniref:ORF56 n=2 Tax=White spot syndrome virus TaxID=342409 RepID=A0A2D3I6U7_9VIRU|nr:ORF56 [White spot syndrome virus]